MSLRRANCWSLLVFLGLCPVAGAQAQAPSHEEAENVGVQVANLKQQLEAGLRIQRPQDFAFIDRVVVMVKNKQLPMDMVKSTFVWARKKEPYPFVYFERGLRTRAAKRGIGIIVPRR